MISKLLNIIKVAVSNKKIVAFLLLIAVVAGIAFGIQRNFFKSNSFNKEIVRNHPEVTVMKLKKRDVEISIDVMGTISFRQKATISSKILGRLEKIYVEQGDYVHRGKALAQIETLPLRLELKSARAELKAAKAGYQLSLEKLIRAKKNIEREFSAIDRAKIDYKDKYSSYRNMNKLYKKKKELYKVGGITETDLDSIKTQYINFLSGYMTAKKNYEIQRVGYRDSDIVKAGLTPPESRDERKKILANINTKVEFAEAEAARNNLNKIHAEIEKLKINIRETTIKSPITGIVAVRNVEIGERMKQDTDLFVVMNTREIIVVTNINEMEIGTLKKNQPVSFTVDAVPGKVFKGRIFLISPVLDTSTRTVEVKIIASNHNGKLKPGMFARARISLSKEKNTILLPEKAIRNENNESYVFIVNKNTVYKKKITTGKKSGNNLVVTKGLQENNIVAISDKDILTDGMQIAPVNDRVEYNKK